MKKIILIFAVATMTVACTSKKTTNPIVGTWVNTSTKDSGANSQKNTITFNSDGTVKSNTVYTCATTECPSNINYTGTYTTKGTALNLTTKVDGKDRINVATYSISGNKLTINFTNATDESTRSLVYTKQ